MRVPLRDATSPSGALLLKLEIQATCDLSLLRSITKESEIWQWILMIKGIETTSQQLAMPISGAGSVSISGVVICHIYIYFLDELSGEV